jgi:hypothetical protein
MNQRAGSRFATSDTRRVALTIILGRVRSARQGRALVRFLLTIRLAMYGRLTGVRDQAMVRWS